MSLLGLPIRSYRSINQRNRRGATVHKATMSVARQAVRAAMLMSEQLESRRLLATYSGTANADTFLIQVGGGNVTVTINGTPNIQTDASVASIVIDALGGNDTITLINNATTNPTTINAGDGDDTITIGGGFYDTNIDSTISVTDGLGTLDQLVFSDTSDVAGNDTYTMTGTRTLVKPGSSATTWAGMDSVVVNGSPIASTYSVRTDNASGNTTINGGGAADTFNVGDGLDLGNAIDAGLTLNGGAGNDSVTLDDTTETTATTYTLDANGLGSTQMGGSIRVAFNSILSATLNASSAAVNDTFNILDLNGISNTTINASAGNDTLNYGNGVADINTIDVNITFNGQVGTDQLNYNSQTTVLLGAKTVTSTTIDSTQHGILTHGTMEALVMNLSGLSETVTFQSTPLTALTTVNAGAGDDTVNIGFGDFVLTVDENVTVNGGLGTDSLLIDDSTNATARTWALPGNSATASLDAVTWSTLAGDQVELVSLLGGTGADTFNKTFSNGNSEMTINGGSGNDTMNAGNAGSLGNWPGIAVFEGAVGIDSLSIDDSAANVTAQTYSFNSDVTTLMTRTGFAGSVGFNSSTESVVLNTGTGGVSALAQTINVNAVAAISTSTLTINTGDGNDTTNVGGGDWGQNIDRDVIVNSGTGTDRLVIDDSTNPDSDIYTLNAGSMTSSDAGTAIIQWDINLLNIDLTGSGFADTFTVAAMRVNDNVSLRGGAGNDSLGTGTVPDDLDNTITGDLTFLGDADVDSIVLSDSELADGPEDYNIDFNSFDKVTATFGSLFYSTTTENLNFSLDDDASLITIGAIGSGQSMTVNGGAGNDTFTNDSGNDWTSDWNGDLTLTDSSGTDSLLLNNTIDAVASTYLITATTFQSTAGDTSGLISYELIQTINWTDGTGASTFNFEGIGPNVTGVTLNAGDGNDTINVGGAAGTDLDDTNTFGGIVSTISLAGGIGTDSLHFRDTDNEVGDDTYLLDDPSLTVGSGGVNPVVFDWSTVEALALTGSALAHTYNLEDTNTPATVTGGTAADNFQLAPTGQNLDALLAMTLIGGGGSDSLTANDDLDTVADSYVLTNNVLDGSGFASFTYTDFARINLDANGDNNAITVTSMLATTVADISGGAGTDTFNIGGAGTGDTGSIDGNVTILGSAGIDSVNYNDQLNAAVSTYTLGLGASQRIQRTGTGELVVGVDIESVTINTGSANNTTNWNSWNSLFPGIPTLNAGAGDDTINVGNGDFDSNIGKSLQINPGTGIDSLVINDTTDNDVGDTYTFDLTAGGTFLDSGNSATVSLFYNGTGTEALVLNLPSGNETVNAIDVADVTRATVNGGLGNDTVIAASGSIEFFTNSQLFFDGQGGTNQMVLDDSTAGDPDTWAYNALTPVIGQVVNTNTVNTSDFRFTNISLLTHNSGGQAERYDINALVCPVTINAGAGNDTLDYGGTANNVDPIDFTMTFGGGADADLVLFDDSASPAGRIYTIEGTFLDSSASNPVNYTAETVSLNSGVGNDTVFVDGTAAATLYDVAAGGGTDRFDVGDSTNDIDANIFNSITLGGGAGNDTINYNDTGDTADPDSYTLDSSDLFSKSSLPVGVVVDGNSIETTNLNANNGSNIITVNTAPSNLTVNANGGDDSIRIADGGTSVDPVIISSGAGLDTVNIDSDADAVEAFARFAATDEIAAMLVGTGSTLQNGPGNSTTILTNTINVGGAFDVAAGFLVVRVGVLPLANFTAGVAVGYNGGLWNGASSAINSSAANASARSDGVGIRLGTDPNAGAIVTFGGQAVNPGDILMAYVQNGDTDLDRDVDFDDLLRLSQNYNLAAPRAWTQGNSDYDGDVDFDDLLGLAQNYGLPFLTVSTSSSGLSDARSALASAAKRRGVSAATSRAIGSALRILDEQDDTVFTGTAVIS